MLEIIDNRNGKIKQFNDTKTAMKAVEVSMNRIADGIGNAFRVSEKAVPKSFIAGLAFGGDVTAPIRSVLDGVSVAITLALNIVADTAVVTQEAMDAAKEHASNQAEYDLAVVEEDYSGYEMLYQLRNLIRQEPAKRLELFTLVEAMNGALGDYQAALARGLRLLEDRTRFRTQTASQVQTYRYKDMAFRIFRNDALQKYRAQFDLAARYVYLAAKAYDYETNLLGEDRRAGQFFLTSIIRSRAIGKILDGVPQTASGVGDPGLADAMARMKLNWTMALEGQLGFNNPQTETNRFSLKYEWFRCVDDATWEEVLRRHVVNDVLTYREFDRYCRVFQPHELTEPAIVIPVSTTINFGFNFFGRELAGGDSAYDSTNFATKVRAVGVWFGGYDDLQSSAGLSNTPRVYLIPVGYDVMRSPTGETGEIRTWKILDQKLPIPFPIGQADLGDPAWIPMVDTLSEEYAAIRRFSSFRAYHDTGEIIQSEMTMDSRLIGRSVWNTRWLLIIPAGTLHSDRQYGLEKFIEGVTDIRVFFQTYAYSGN
jgi:hypothetical protein